jgi:hypothetical protein
MGSWHRTVTTFKFNADLHVTNSRGCLACGWPWPWPSWLQRCLALPKPAATPVPPLRSTSADASRCAGRAFFGASGAARTGRSAPPASPTSTRSTDRTRRALHALRATKGLARSWIAPRVQLEVSAVLEEPAALVQRASTQALLAPRPARTAPRVPTAPALEPRLASSVRQGGTSPTQPARSASRVQRAHTRLHPASCRATRA